MINTVTNATPRMTIITKCEYFGLATKSIQTPIPIMITAVLKLLAATIPTSGSNITPITTRLATFPMFLDNFSTRTAKNNMTTSFAISDGWNCIGPSASHLDDPCESVPIPGTYTSIQSIKATTYANV